MPYIGRDLNRGNYLKLDDISSSFNSSTTTFNLTVGGSAFTPGSAFSILVSVGGVIQEPESSYQVNNSEITFANAPTAQDSFFCIALAVPIGIGVPGNGTVNGTQLAKPFNYDGFFYLNDGTNRVGINSSSPTVALDVIGDIKLNGNLVTGGGGGGNFGIVTCTGLDLNGNGDVSGNFVIGGDLTVNGTTSTIDTNLIGVDRVEVGANSNTVAGIAVTQSGSADLVRLYDGSTQVVTIDDEGKVGLGSAIPSEKLDVIGNIKAGGDILIPTNVDSTDAGGVAVQRFWTTGNISAGNIYKCGQWFETEGSVQLLISVRAIGASHSGGSVYLWQGGYNQIGGSGISRLTPLTSGNGHGNGADTGVDSNSWGVLIHQANVRTYAVWVYNNTGTATKNLQISVTELNRGNDFTDISSTVALSSVSINAGKLNSIKTTAIQELHINGSNGIIHDGDPDTKIKFPTANAFSIETAGDERFRITSTGDVGIGSIIPSAKLDVAGIVKATDFKAPDGNTNGLYAGNSDDLHLFHNGSDSYVENDTGNLTLTNKNSNNIIFKTTSSETEVVRITSAGRVGIGTDNPDYQLGVVAPSGKSSIEIKSKGTGANDDVFLRMRPAGTNKDCWIDFGDDDDADIGGIRYNHSSDFMTFTTDANERLRITSDGEMLIGTNGSDRLIAGQNFNSSNGWSGAVQIEKQNPTQGNSVIPMLAITAYNGANNQYTGGISFNRSSHNAQGTHGAVNTNQQLGNIAFNGSDGTNFIQGAEIFAIPDQTFATNDGPASLVFATTPDGTSEDEPQERLRINSSGQITPGAAGTQDLGSTSKEFRNLYVGAGGTVYLGEGQDLRVYYNGSTNDSYVSHAGTGSLKITTPSGKSVVIEEDDANLAMFTANTGVKLYDGSNNIRLQTNSDGVEVTGEVATTQDYPVVKPTLDLNFAGTANLDPRVTFTRVGSASYYGRDGLLKFAAHNEPRFDHDPITRECKGLLIEEERQNWAYNSYRANNDYGGGGATFDDMGYNMINNAVTINDFGTAPDGTNTATKMYPASSGSARGIELQMSLSSTGNWTNSIYVKAAGHTGWIALYGVNGGARAYFNPSTGAKGGSGGTGAPSSGKYGIQDVGNGWYRIHITVNLTTTGGTEYHYIYFGDSDNSTTVTASGTNGILMWGLQVEKGDFPTSYIRTDSSHRVTRGADQCYIDGQDFLDFYNQTEGTMISSHSILSDEIPSSHNLYTYQIAPTGTTAYAPLRVLDRNSSIANSIAVASVYNNGYSFLTTDTGNPVTVAGRKYVIAASIKKDDYDAVYNGGDLLSDSSGDLYTADHISIGYYKPSPQAYLNGHIQRLTYYPFKLTNNQLKTVTS